MKERKKRIYIKYNDSIDENLFNKLLQKLKSIGLTPYSHTNNSFKDFNREGYFWIDEVDDSQQYGVDNNPQGCEEETFEYMLERYSIDTKEYLLAEAKRRYPVGTKYKHEDWPKGIDTVEENDKIKFYKYSVGNDKWAEIKQTTKPKPKPKYNIGDEVTSIPGGWQFSQMGLEYKDAIGHLSSDKNILQGKITEITYSNKNKIYFYKIDSYNNMFTENAIELIESKEKKPMKTHFKHHTWYKSELGSFLFYDKDLHHTELTYIHHSNGLQKMLGLVTLTEPINGWTETNIEEVKPKLIEAAKKKGFVKGVHFISALYGDHKESHYGIFTYRESHQSLYLDDNTVWHKGEWATIVKDEQKKSDTNHGFIKGEWYKCTCNSNFYRFHYIKDDKYFVNDGQINPTKRHHGGQDPGYHEVLNEQSLLEYFRSSDIVSKGVIEQYLPNPYQWELSLDVLPEKWAIKSTKGNIDRIGSFYNMKCGTDFYTKDTWVGRYFHSHNLTSGNSIVNGFKSGSHSTSLMVEDGFTEITLDQFEQIVTQKEPSVFNLPKKWCIKLENKEIVDYTNKYGTVPPYFISSKLYAHFPSFDGCTTSEDIKRGYTEITFDQFKKCVLKEQPKIGRVYVDTETEGGFIFDEAGIIELKEDQQRRVLERRKQVEKENPWSGFHPHSHLEYLYPMTINESFKVKSNPDIVELNIKKPKKSSNFTPQILNEKTIKIN